MPLFQFTPLREGRPRFRPAKPVPNFISIHAPPRGATICGGLDCSRCIFQFTPLREGRLGVTLATIYNFISIHAPPRGATTIAQAQAQAQAQFQFTPLREGRQYRFIQKAVFKNFNSRPSARGDDLWLSFKTIFSTISIHAPPRGATCPIIVRVRKCVFQFTPLREGRLRILGTCAVFKHFNSRPSARGDS